jgi:tRNA A37 methylthiotransferase MiaB
LAMLGQELDVFVSNKSRRENQWSGHTTSNRVISFSSQEKELLGSYVRVKVTDSGTGSLVGTHCVPRLEVRGSRLDGNEERATAKSDSSTA